METFGKKLLLIIGSGRLVSRVEEELQKHFGSKYRVGRIFSKEFRENDETEVQEASIENAKNILKNHNIDSASAVVIADGSDDINLHILLAVLKLRGSIPVVATFMHDKIVSALEGFHKNVTIINPAKAASSHIVEMIQKTTESQKRRLFLTRFLAHHLHKPINRVGWLCIGFALLFAIGSGIFYFTQGMPLLQSVYMMTTIITSVNFNDAQLNNASAPIRFAMTILLFVTYFFVLYSLAVIIDEFDKNRTEAKVFGRKRYRLYNHVIVCGLGRVGYELVKKLLDHKIKVLVFEKDENNRFLRNVRRQKVPVFIGDASLAENLEDAGIMNARAVIATVGTVESDFVNLEIAISARSAREDVRVGLRVFDQGMAEEIKHQFKLHHAFSKSSLTARDIKNCLDRILKTEERYLVS